MTGGAHPKKPKKKQSLHQNRQIGIGFFFVFLVFFLVFFYFFWLKLWPTFEIGNCLFRFFGFFLVFFWFTKIGKLAWFFFCFFGVSTPL